eukprot:1222380-Rhodomonas_salina.2
MLGWCRHSALRQQREPLPGQVALPQGEVGCVRQHQGDLTPASACADHHDLHVQRISRIHWQPNSRPRGRTLRLDPDSNAHGSDMQRLSGGRSGCAGREARVDERGGDAGD